MVIILIWYPYISCKEDYSVNTLDSVSDNSLSHETVAQFEILDDTDVRKVFREALESLKRSLKTGNKKSKVAKKKSSKKKGSKKKNGKKKNRKDKDKHKISEFWRKILSEDGRGSLRSFSDKYRNYLDKYNTWW